MSGPAKCVPLKPLKVKYRSGCKHRWKPSAIGDRLTLMPVHRKALDRRALMGLLQLRLCSAHASCQVPGTVGRQYVLSTEHCSHLSDT